MTEAVDMVNIEPINLCVDMSSEMITSVTMDESDVSNPELLRRSKSCLYATFKEGIM